MRPDLFIIVGPSADLVQLSKQLGSITTTYKSNVLRMPWPKSRQHISSSLTRAVRWDLGSKRPQNNIDSGLLPSTWWRKELCFSKYRSQYCSARAVPIPAVACGTVSKRAVQGNPQSITNMAKLSAARTGAETGCG